MVLAQLPDKPTIEPLRDLLEAVVPSLNQISIRDRGDHHLTPKTRIGDTSVIHHDLCPLQSLEPRFERFVSMTGRNSLRIFEGDIILLGLYWRNWGKKRGQM